MAEFSAAAHELSLEILGYMVDGLQVASRKHFQEYLVEQSGTMRVNNYPVCAQPTLYTGLPPHIDACMVTILHQAADVTGLEIENDGSWIGVQPRNDALVVIVGAILQAINKLTPLHPPCRNFSINPTALANHHSYTLFECRNKILLVAPTISATTEI